MLTRFFRWLRFWILWLTSCGLNFLILSTVRQFYMTDDIHSEYFETVAVKVDNWVVFLGGFTWLLLVYLLNAYYKENIYRRFSFVTALQLILLGIVRLASGPFAEKLNAEFQFTTMYTVVSVGCMIVGVILLVIIARTQGERPLRMLKRMLRITRDNKYW